MKIKKSLFALALSLLFFSCTKEKVTTAPPNKPNKPATPVVENGKKYTITGLVQKGPFSKGSRVDIFELTNTFTQTGRIFRTEMKNDLGRFQMDSIELKSAYVEMTADGHYYNEVSGKLSESRLALKAFANLSSKKNVNINILTHLITDRQKALAKGKNNFDTARTKAQNELLDFFQIDTNSKNNFGEMDLSKNEVLIALSAIFQGNSKVAELSKLLADFKEDLADNGIIDKGAIKAQLISNAKKLNTSQVRSNLQAYYSNLGFEITLPNFERIVKNFLSKVNFDPTINLSFPKKGEFGENLFAMKNNSEISKGKEYSITTLFPTNDKYRIKLKLEGKMKWETSNQKNWTGTPKDGQEIVAQLVGEKADMSIKFLDTGRVRLGFYITRLGATEESEYKKITLVVK